MPPNLTCLTSVPVSYHQYFCLAGLAPVAQVVMLHAPPPFLHSPVFLKLIHLVIDDTLQVFNRNFKFISGSGNLDVRRQNNYEQYFFNL